ncbi:MAG TPA: hypothetical protein VGJ73_06090, partial [Verrucomicrobiae bacterium]
RSMKQSTSRLHFGQLAVGLLMTCRIFYFVINKDKIMFSGCERPIDKIHRISIGSMNTRSPGDSMNFPLSRLRPGVRWQVCATPLSHAVAGS